MAQRLSLVQAFLSKKGLGIYLVSLDREHPDLRLVCDCPGFDARGSCKHVRYIFNKMTENDGEYRLDLPKGVYGGTSAEQMTPEQLNELVLRYGKPVVL